MTTAAKQTLPSALLFSVKNPMVYVKSGNTDIRERFARVDPNWNKPRSSKKE